MDELLNQLATEYTRKKEAKAKSKTPPPSPSSNRSPEQSKSSASKIVAPSPAPKKNKANQGDRNKLIAEIEREYQKQAGYREEKLAAIQRQKEAQIAEQKRREQELIAAQQRKEKKEQRRKAALRQKAEQWLKTLNPSSEEGKWFEEFSYSYESKLTAAIDYLEAMRETGL